MEDNSFFNKDAIPKEEVTDLLMNLFKKKAFDEESSVFLSQYPIKEQQLEELIQKDIIHIISQNITQIYLTHIGRILICEELVQQLKKNKTLSNSIFQDQLVKIINNVEKIAEEYELTIKRGNLEKNCPYPAITKIYEYIRQVLIDRDWNDLAENYYKQIQYYQGKIEKDKKLREYEALKQQKQKDSEEMHKVEEIDAIRTVIHFLKKEEEILDFEEKRREEIRESEEVFNMLNIAERMTREYEKEIKKGRILQLNCPYEEIIEIYRDIKKKFEVIGWKEESQKLSDSIRHYQIKVVHDKGLREIEKKKTDRE